MQINANGRRGGKSSLLPIQLLRTMKLTAILLLVGCLQLSANSFSQNVSLKGKNISLEKVLESFGKQTGFFFLYKYNDLKSAKPLMLQLKNVPLEKALQEAFKDQPLQFTIENNTIVVTRKSEEKNIPAPTIVVKELMGKVLDERGEPLVGATIKVKGSTKYAVSNEVGGFSLKDLDDDAVLIITYTGFEAAEIAVGGRTNITVVLKDEDANMKAVVVVGYGTQKKKDITGSVATVSAKQLRDQPVISVDAALAGQVAGVQVSQTTGAPGGGATIRVRGAGSLSAGNEPLYVIDGFPMTNDYNQINNPIATLNPNDIESIQILKDASATAIYGSRGSNGVIIITTKSGKSGKSKINLDVYNGFQDVPKRIDVLDAETFGRYINESRNNGWVSRNPNNSVNDPNSVRNNALYNIPSFTADPSTLGKGTNWQDEIFRTAPIRNYQLSFSGGNDKTTYYVSGGYMDQQGVVLGSDYKRYSFKLNLESKVSNRIRVGANITPTFQVSNVSNAEGHWSSGGMILSALLLAPHLPVYNPDGTYTTGLTLANGFSNVENPVKSGRERVNKFNQLRLLGTAFAEVEIIKDLTFKTLAGADIRNLRNNTFVPSVVGRDGAPPPQIPTASAQSDQFVNWLAEYTLNYKKQIGEHQFDALAGYTAQMEDYQMNNVTATNFPNDLVQTINAGVINGGSSLHEQWSLISMLARVNYSFKNKYLLTATIRRDGSSRFGANNKWGNFPSVSAGWKISEEKFMSNVDWISDLRLRASYGVTGNNFIGNYEHIALISASNYSLGGGSGTIVNGLRPSTFGNASLGWERNNQLDLGLEFSLFNNRLNVTAEYYDKRTADLLLDVPVPTITGFGNATQNVGKIRNHGFEFALNTRNLTGAFKWNTDFNISFNKNEVLRLGPSGAPIFGTYQLSNTHITQIGGPLGAYYGYKVIGIFQNAQDLANSPKFADSRAGHFKFEDYNGDGVLSTADRQVLGSPVPDFTWGLNNNFSFKGFELNVLLQGVQGFEIMNLGRRFYANSAGTGNSLRVTYENAWRSETEPGDGKTPRINRDLATYSSSNSSANLTSEFIEDGSFVRVRNITLGYNFPSRWINRIKAQNIRLYASVQNAFTFTKYIGYNPEISVAGANTLTPGVDYGGYPVARTFTFGFNLGF